MATVDYTFAFNSDAQGFVDSGSTDVTFGWSSGGVRFVSGATPPITGTGIALQAPGTNTFQDMGVPFGATVTAVTVMSFLYAIDNVAMDLTIDMMDAAGVSIGGILRSSTFLSNGDPFSSPRVMAPASNTPSGISIPGGLPYNTDVRFRLDYNPHNSGGPNQVCELDNIVIRITYTPLDGGGGPECGCGNASSALRPLSIRYPWLGAWDRNACGSCGRAVPPNLRLTAEHHMRLFSTGTPYWFPGKIMGSGTAPPVDLPGYLLFMDSLGPTLYLDTNEVTMKMDSVEPTLVMDAQYK